MSGQHLDFTQLPLEEAAESLQSVGLALVEHLLANDEAAVKPWFDKVQAEILGNKQRKLHETILNYTVRAFGHERTFTYENTIQRGIAGTLPRNAWQARAEHQWEKRAGLISRKHIPDDLWLLIADKAWGDPTFQHTLSNRLSNHFRDKVLLSAGEIPTIALHSNTFWLLLAWAGSQIRLQPRPRTLRKATKRLVRLGHLYGLTEQWAGLWDQWLLGEAIELWGFDRTEMRLRLAVEQIGLFGYVVAADAENPIPNMSVLNWYEGRPTWFDALRKERTRRRVGTG